jgi:Family of unknown function (DUF6134)
MSGLALGKGKDMTKGNRCVRPAPLASTTRVLMVAAIVGVLTAGQAASIAVAETPAQFIYRVSHSTFGDIGTYTNTVEPGRDGTTVQTRAHFEVSMLGVRMYREDAERTERWQGNRLVSFHGVTDKGNGPAEVKGEARGNGFVITSPQGTITAPASVHPANPWSNNFLTSNTMMRPDSGKIEQVRVGSGQETTVKIDGATIPAVKFEIDGSTKYTVWLDGRGVPVKFIADDDTGKVTFTLVKCISCGPETTQLGTR